MGNISLVRKVEMGEGGRDRHFLSFFLFLNSQGNHPLSDLLL